uniref:BTB domain-containing protein n=1 Tax=Strigamia maritima TaxID=126957 RepID=T1J071_STRMM
MTSNNRVITSVDPQSLVEVNLKENQQRLILTNLYKSRDDGKSDQVVLECQDGQILAHKSVLRSGSDYFRGMFTHATTENEFNRVLLHDTSIEVMNIIIKFIYAQDIPSRLEMTGALMAETLIAADKMQLNILFNNYWILFTTPITLDNFSNIWQLAELLTKEDTIHKVQVFLIIHMKQLMEAEFLCDMTVMQLESLVTKVKPHKLGEFIILLATWGLKTVREESNTENVLNLMTKCELKKLPQYSLKHLLSNEIVRKLAPIYNILSKEASSRWSTMPKKQQIQIFAFAVRSYGLCRFSVSFLDDLYPAVSKTGEIYYLN